MYQLLFHTYYLFFFFSNNFLYDLGALTHTFIHRHTGRISYFLDGSCDHFFCNIQIRIPENANWIPLYMKYTNNVPNSITWGTDYRVSRFYILTARYTLCSSSSSSLCPEWVNLVDCVYLDFPWKHLFSMYVVSHNTRKMNLSIIYYIYLSCVVYLIYKSIITIYSTHINRSFLDVLFNFMLFSNTRLAFTIFKASANCEIK